MSCLYAIKKYCIITVTVFLENKDLKNLRKKKYKGTGIKDEQFLYSLADPGYLSWIPDLESKRFPDPGSASASKNLIILTQKLFHRSRKYNPGCSSRIRIPDPDFDFLPIPDPGVK